MRNCQIFSQSGCTILHSNYWSTRAPISSHPYQHLLLYVFFIIAILVGVKYLKVVLICISLMNNDIEQFFTCLLAICWSLLKKCLFKSFAHFYWVVFQLPSCKSCLYFQNTIPLSDIWFANIFFPSGDCLFTFLRVCFEAK